MTSKEQTFPNVDDMKKKLADRLKVVNEENAEKKKVFMYNLEQASNEYYENFAPAENFENCHPTDPHRPPPAENFEN